MKLSMLKRSLVCKYISEFNVNTDLVSGYVPSAGDVALFEVQELGKIIRIQDDRELRVNIFPGDYLLAAFGDRYATSQVEAYVPGFCQHDLHLAGSGGVIGEVHSQNARLKDLQPTRVKLVGYATGLHGEVLNTKFINVQRRQFSGNFRPGAPRIILSLGSAMDSGKTTIAGGLARGLTLNGSKVAYMKLTGTAFTKDRNFVSDCGAALAVDFSDVGFTSTYMCSHQEILDIFETLMYEHILEETHDYLIIEIADGLFQRENKVLLRDRQFTRLVDHVIFSGGDSLSAMYGLQLLGELGLKPFALSGKFTMSPLLVREVKELADVPVLTLDELMMPEVSHFLNPQKSNLTDHTNLQPNNEQKQESAA